MYGFWGIKSKSPVFGFCINPLLGCHNPLIILKSDVLPQPDGPVIKRVSLLLIFMLRSLIMGLLEPGVYKSAFLISISGLFVMEILFCDGFSLLINSTSD